MTVDRTMKMYEDKPAIRPVFLGIFFVGLGMVVSSHNGSIGCLVMKIIALVIGVQFLDALVKGIVLIKENFGIHLKESKKMDEFIFHA